MSRFQDHLERVVSGLYGQVSVAAATMPGSPSTVLFEVNADEVYWAASVAKLSIALYINFLIEQGTINWHDMLRLEQDHIRPGTGVMCAFPDGTWLSVRQAHDLMLCESDNTATNVLLSYIGSQNEINRWLYRQGIVGLGGRSGLADRDDRLFQSAQMTARDALNILRQIKNVYTLAAMSRSHFGTGLRSAFECSSLWSRHRYKVVKSAARACGLPGLRLLPRAPLLRLATQRPANPRVMNKEGILDHEGHKYLHDVGFIIMPDGSYLAVAIFTCDAEQGALGRVARIIEWDLDFLTD